MPDRPHGSRRRRLEGFLQLGFGWNAHDEFDDDGNQIYTQFNQGDHVVAGLDL